MQQADVRALDRIAHILIDQVDLYLHAAKIADDPQTRKVIASAAKDCSALLSDVNKKLFEIGGLPEDKGTMMGAGAKAVLNARSLLQNDDKVAITEVRRGEDYLRDQIVKKAEDEALSGEIKEYCQSLLPRVARTHASITAIRH